MNRARRAALGAGVALGAGRLPTARLPGGARRWTRTNHRGREVTLLPGPVLALAAGLSDGPAGLVAGLAAAAVGAYDDVVGQRPDQRASKGLRGHARALRSGRITSGTVKVAGLAATGLVTAGLRGSRGRDLLLDGALLAGSANLLNLLDLRPGRALKVALVTAVLLDRPGPAAAAAVLLPADLRERAMLGDTGANALGAVLGVGLAERLPAHADRLRALAVLTGLTAASEVVSFTSVIAAVPPLRALDRLGRLP